MEKTAANRAVGRAIFAAMAAALVIKIFILDFMIAEGHSMAPAIKPGSVIVVCKVFYGIRLPAFLGQGAGRYLVRWRLPRKGDVVVFYTPLGEIAVKRCAEILEGHEFYALGDNILQSYDSRIYGPVGYDNIIGKALGVK